MLKKRDIIDRSLQLFMCHVKLDNETLNNLFSVKKLFLLYGGYKCILIDLRVVSNFMIIRALM